VCKASSTEHHASHSSLLEGTDASWVLQAYAASFFVIPAIRMVLNMQRNAALKSANQNRLQRLREVREPEPSLQRKLLSAQRQAKRKIIKWVP